MADVREFRQKLRMLFCPNDVRRGDAFSEVGVARETRQGRDFVAVNRAAHLQTVPRNWPREKVHHPRPLVVDVAAISGSGDGPRAPIPEPYVVSHSKGSRGEIALGQHPDKMYRLKSPTEPDHFRPIDCCL